MSMAFLTKVLWSIRAIFMKPFFKKMTLPGYFGKPTFICGRKRITVGKNFRIFPYSRFETHGEGELIIEEDVAIAQNCHFTCASLIVIGSGTAIAPNVCITDISHKFEDPTMPPLAQGITSNSVIIGRNCFIGFGAFIAPGTQLGDYCVVGANSVVSGLFEASSVIAGSPARVIRAKNPD